MKKSLLLIILIVLAAIGVGYVLVNRRVAKLGHPASVVEEQHLDASHTAGWKTYYSNSEHVSIRYPPNVQVAESGGKITLEHSWPLHHQDPCDEKGDIPPRENLTDFFATLEVVKSSMKEVVKKNETQELIKDYFKGDTFQLSSGFIDELSVGQLHGYGITSGVEGCGNWRYYFPLDANTTLVINRDFGEFLSLAGLQAAYGTNPSAILPNQADEIFARILENLRIIK